MERLVGGVVWVLTMWIASLFRSAPLLAKTGDWIASSFRSAPLLAKTNDLRSFVTNFLWKFVFASGSEAIYDVDRFAPSYANASAWQGAKTFAKTDDWRLFV